MTKTQVTPWFVSRQHYYTSGAYVVEIEINGLDYAGSDMLVANYPGEGKEYDDPREAVEAAIQIRDAWRRDSGNNQIGVALGTTGGMGMEIEASESDDDLRRIAAESYAKLPMCDQCGELRRESYYIGDDPDYGKFCSESCCFTADERRYIDLNIDQWRENARRELLGYDKHSLALILDRHVKSRNLNVDRIVRRYRKGRLADAILNNMTENEIRQWGDESI